MRKVNIPDGEFGICRVEKFTVPKGFFAWKEGVTPGEYTRLFINGSLMMSDTPMEMDEHYHFVYRAKGDVLINGLGLGMVILNIMDRPEVRSITVNEICPDVIALIGPVYSSSAKVKINLADAYTWRPENGNRFDSIWHDIWGDVSTDALQEMSKLNRRYARWLAPGGYQGCWRQKFLKSMKRRGR